jgi:hypothetical protein
MKVNVIMKTVALLLSITTVVVLSQVTAQTGNCDK